MRDFHLPNRSAVFATNGMCATSHPLAAHIAVDILKQGGNAVDAAVAGALVLGLCEPHMAGIGGDCFVLVASPAHETIALNGSGAAAQSLNAADLRAQGYNAMPTDARAVTVPGAIDAFCRLLSDYGVLERASVFAPAINYARIGVPLAPRVVFDWALARPELAQIPSMRDCFLYRQGSTLTTPHAGDLYRCEQQAMALERIAEQGRDAFYTGEIADDMLAALHANGGTHTADDFAAQHSFYDRPVVGKYKHMELLEHPPNAQGAVAILLCNILNALDLPALAPVPMAAKRVHIEAEAVKYAYEWRNRVIADRQYVHAGMLDDMLDPQTAQAIATRIDPHKARIVENTLPTPVHKDTVYITVVDCNRMSVSLIYSLFHRFGAKIVSDRFGILMHNRGAGFVLEEGHPNAAMAGKRPLHTIIPAMLRQNGQVFMPFGVMGGAYQINGHARLLSNLYDYDLPLQTAIDAPRAFADISTGELLVERGYGGAVHRELEAMGHKVTVPDMPIGGAQAIVIDTKRGVLIGASDPRKDGCVIGY